MRRKTKNTVLGKPEKVRKMSVDLGGYYVVVLVVRKGADLWQNAEQMARVTYASARTAAEKDAIQQAGTQSPAR